MLMAAIRGLRSSHPCPTCVVHANDMTDPSAASSAPLRTTQNMQAIYNQAQELAKSRKSKQKDELLKEVGLRDVEVFIGYLLPNLAITHTLPL